MTTNRSFPPASFAIWLAGLILAGQAAAQPSLTRISPQAVRPGETTEVTLHGAKLDEPLDLWTSFPANVERVPQAKKSNTQVVYRITLDKSVPVSVGGLIVGTSAGVSNTQYVLVDDLPTVAQSPANRDMPAAHSIGTLVAIDGVSRASGADFYRFSARSGQRLSIEVGARRIGSPLDPVMWLRDREGRELAYADDDPSVGVDCRLSYRFAADGDYFVELRDNAYAGGHPYRLRIGDFPIHSTTWPLGGQTGQSVSLQLAGGDVEPGKAIAVTMPAAASHRAVVGVKLPGGKSSAIAAVAVSHLTNVLESEPNDVAKTANEIARPCAINGRLNKAEDQDRFTFTARQGERLTLRVLARQLGSPCYTRLRLFGTGSAPLAESQISESEDATLNFTAPADGTYQLAVSDQFNSGGPGYTYRVEISPTPPFSLALKTDKTGRYQFTAAPDGAIAVDVQCSRFGFNGAVTLAAQSGTDTQPNGTVLPVYPERIADKQAGTRLFIELPSEWKAGSLHVIRLFGAATIDGQAQTASVSSRALLRSKQPLMTHPLSWHDGLLAVSIGGKPPVLFTASREETAAAVVSPGGSVNFKLVMERKHKDFKAALIVGLAGLPEGATYSVKRNGDGAKETYEIKVDIAQDAPPGQYALRAVCLGELNGDAQKTVLDGFSFEVKR